MTKIKIKTLTSLFLTLSGCQFYSKVDQPKPSIDGQYLNYGEFSNLNIKENFFENFNDPLLIQYLQIGIKNNSDLKIALEKILEAESFYKIESAPSYPSIDLDLDAQRTRSSQKGFSEIQGSPFSLGVGQNKSVVTNIFLQAFNLNWEIDFFGRIRNQKKRAQLQIEEMQAYKRGVELTLVADISITYFALSAYYQLINLHKCMINELKKLIEYKKSEFFTGIYPTQNILEIQQKLYSFEQDLQDLEKSYAIFNHHMIQLLGDSSLNFIAVTKDFQPIEIKEIFLNIGIPLDLLRNRPDIIIAEKQLIQSGYSVKIAKANLFPTISLLGAFGYANNTFSDWFSYPNSFWSLGPSLRWPAFKGFRYLSELDVQKSKQKQAIDFFQSTLLKGLEDVENCLVTFFNQEKIAKLAEDKYRTQLKIFDANLELVRVGLKSQEFAIDQYLVKYDYKKKMILDQFNTIQALIQLYKALGGEWK